MQVYPVFLPLAGCPHRCRFCRHRGAELPAPAAVAAELERILPVCGAGEIAYYGGSFTLLPPEIQSEWLAVAAPFRSAGRIGGVRISTRPDAVSAIVADALWRQGVKTVELGCQSFSAEVLARAGRGHRPEAAAEALRLLRQAGMQVGLQLMPGLPGGDRREALASLQAAFDLKPDFLRLYPTVVFRGTPLEADWREGAYRPWSLEEAIDCCAELLWRCRQAGVPVIRLGLQEERGLAGEIVAGPWHPAFGQLVRSRLWLLALRHSARRTGRTAARVARTDLGDALGHRRQNQAALRGEFGNFEIAADSALPRQSLTLGGQLVNLWEMDLYGHP